MTTEYFQNRAVHLDNIWTRAEVAKTAQQIHGVIQATQNLGAHRVLQEKGCPLAGEHHKVPVLGVS